MNRTAQKEEEPAAQTPAGVEAVGPINHPALWEEA